MRLSVCAAVLFSAVVVLTGSNTPKLSYYALESLINMEATFTITTLTGNAIPVYRKDLPTDYVAYWQVTINDKDFALISAGPQTGDHKIIHEGPLPSFTTMLDEESHGTCRRYFVLTTDGTMMCENEANKIVATTSTELLHEQDNAEISRDDAIPFDSDLRSAGLLDDNILHGILQNELEIFTKDFGNLRGDMKKSLIWVDAEGDMKTSMYKPTVQLEVGDRVLLPVKSEAFVVASKASQQEYVCLITGLCLGEEKNIREGVIKETSYHEKYLEFDVKNLADEVVTSVAFKIVIKGIEGKQIVRLYSVSFGKSRQRRQSSWVTYSIPEENLFPEYTQQKYGKCQVGCGPVAWASVFGYLDRRAHDKYPTYGSASRCFYRKGSDAMSGSCDQRAPKYVDGRTRKYIERFNKILRTFCLFGGGATTTKRMERVSSYCKGIVNTCKLHHKRPASIVAIFGPYHSKYRDAAIDLIKKGSPAIIGWKIDGKLFKQHYPIATKYRRRQKKVKQCKKFLWWKWSCKTVTVWERQFYLHMGWGGSKNGWKKAQAFMSAGVTL